MASKYSEAEKIITRQALDTLVAWMEGDTDGYRRSPWANFEMDRDEDESVPAELTSREGYLATIKALHERVNR